MKYFLLHEQFQPDHTTLNAGSATRWNSGGALRGYCGLKVAPFPVVWDGHSHWLWGYEKTFSPKRLGRGLEEVDLSQWRPVFLRHAERMDWDYLDHPARTLSPVGDKALLFLKSNMPKGLSGEFQPWIRRARARLKMAEGFPAGFYYLPDDDWNVLLPWARQNPGIYFRLQSSSWIRLMERVLPAPDNLNHMAAQIARKWVANGLPQILTEEGHFFSWQHPAEDLRDALVNAMSIEEPATLDAFIRGEAGDCRTGLAELGRCFQKRYGLSAFIAAQF